MDGIPALLDELIATYQDGIYSGVWRMTGDRWTAEDITQETFIRAFRAMGKMSPERIAQLQAKAWLWRIAMNLCRDRARRARRRPREEELASEIMANTDDPAVRAGNRDTARRLADCLLTLATPVRTAIVLHHVADLTYEEMSRVLREPVGTLRSRVHRGLRELRARHGDVLVELAS